MKTKCSLMCFDGNQMLPMKSCWSLQRETASFSKALFASKWSRDPFKEVPHGNLLKGSTRELSASCTKGTSSYACASRFFLLALYNAYTLWFFLTYPASETRMWNRKTARKNRRLCTIYHVYYASPLQKQGGKWALRESDAKCDIATLHFFTSHSPGTNKG